MTSEIAKEAAITNARNVSGVKKVLDQLYLVEDAVRPANAGRRHHHHQGQSQPGRQRPGPWFEVNVEVNRGVCC